MAGYTMRDAIVQLANIDRVIFKLMKKEAETTHGTAKANVLDQQIQRLMRKRDRIQKSYDLSDTNTDRLVRQFVQSKGR